MTVYVCVCVPVDQRLVGSHLCETIEQVLKNGRLTPEEIQPFIHVNTAFDLILSVAQLSVMVLSSGLEDWKNGIQGHLQHLHLIL